MGKEVSFENSYGESLSGYLHTPNKEYSKGIVLAHSFTGSKHQKIMRETCDMLKKEGFLVLRFDFAGNGESEGNFEEATYSKEIEDLGHAVNFLIDKRVNGIGLIGHSMGAAVSILHSSMDERIKSLCVISGSSDATSIREVFSKEKLDEIYSKGKATVEVLGRRFTMVKEFFEDIKKHNIKKALKSYKGAYCGIHGDKDEVISIKHAKKLYNYANTPKELHIIKGADHMFADNNKFQEMKLIVKEFFNKTCK